MFYYIEVYLLAHYIEWIKMHGETVKYLRSFNNVMTWIRHCNISGNPYRYIANN
jgi:hypothetical protein